MTGVGTPLSGPTKVENVVTRRYRSPTNTGSRVPYLFGPSARIVEVLCLRVLRSLSSILDATCNQLVSSLTGLNRMERILAGQGLMELIWLRNSEPPPTRLSESNLSDFQKLHLVETFLKQQSLLGIPLFMDPNLDAGQVSIAGRKLVEDVLHLKPRFYASFEKITIQLRIAKQAQRALYLLEATPFNQDNPEHQQVLTQLRNLLWEDKTSTTTEADDKVWKYLGFQSEPFRDFRGAGLLGALNLLSFAQNHRIRAKEVLREANSLEQSLWFPFAVTGLNITSWLMELLEDDLLNVFFFHNPNAPLDTFNVVFAFVFLQFSRFWKLSRPANILQFGQISRRFLVRIRGTLLGLVKPSSHSEWLLSPVTSGEDLVNELKSWIDGEAATNSTLNSSSVLQSTDEEKRFSINRWNHINDSKRKKEI